MGHIAWLGTSLLLVFNPREISIFQFNADTCLKSAGAPPRNTDSFLVFCFLLVPPQQLVCGNRDTALLSRAEQKRLAKLLQEIDEEEEAASRGADSEVGRHQVLTDNMC